MQRGQGDLADADLVEHGCSTKRKGVTETTGTKADKKAASGHVTDAMVDVYDQSLPRVTTPGNV